MRIQLDLAEEKVARLKVLMATLDMDTYKVLFNNALAVFEWIVEETQSGRVVASVDEENRQYNRLVLPALQNVSRAVKSETNGQLAAKKVVHRKSFGAP